MPEIQTSVLISEKEIHKKVSELADTLNQKFQNKKLTALCTLKGAFTFYADLLRQLKADIVCDFCATSCYGLKQKPSEEVRLVLDAETDLAGQDILLVEDIVDRGLTLQFLQAHLKKRKPRSITTVVLITKPKNIIHPCQIDHKIFEIHKKAFLVGYGMDYQEQFRHLPYIAEISNLN